MKKFVMNSLGAMREIEDDEFTMRDYFAAKAMQSVLGSLNGALVYEEVKGDWLRYSNTAYEIADAMMKAREQ